MPCTRWWCGFHGTHTVNIRFKLQRMKWRDQRVQLVLVYFNEREAMRSKPRRTKSILISSRILNCTKLDTVKCRINVQYKGSLEKRCHIIQNVSEIINWISIYFLQRDLSVIELQSQLCLIQQIAWIPLHCCCVKCIITLYSWQQQQHCFILNLTFRYWWCASGINSCCRVVIWAAAGCFQTGKPLPEPAPPPQSLEAISCTDRQHDADGGEMIIRAEDRLCQYQCN